MSINKNWVDDVQVGTMSMEEFMEMGVQNFKSIPLKTKKDLLLNGIIFCPIF